jgi:hypothetical protein
MQNKSVEKKNNICAMYKLKRKMQAQACAYPLWEALTETQQRHIKTYNDKRAKNLSKGKPMQRNFAIETLINAFFSVHDGFMPPARDINCGHAYYHMVGNWINFLAAARAHPNGAAALAALRCPVTMDWFVHPMLFPSGNSYNESIIPQLTSPQGTIVDPTTRGVVVAATIKENYPLHEILAGWSISHQRDKGEELGGGKYRKITRRCRRHKMKRTKKRHSSKKSKRM